MSILYFLAYAGVALVLAGILFEAVRGVSRKPVWAAAREIAWERPFVPPLQPVEALPVDARHSGFVGLANDEEWKMTA